ncbi:hypothetical protein [Bifidobacterium sp. SO1]|uniref:hypothetical protein n=1 Tax=Bifidobacterium sp. SO1 TaxID=2809029 RepID=UPI001BDC4729|nr:hypothetical protein [Bifidobacterium sp. SO1]MBT1161231.1 hypothetical protein [Bifidobacterium sp. SO1]
MGKYVFNHPVLKRLLDIDSELGGGFVVCDPYNVPNGGIIAPLKYNGVQVGRFWFRNGTLRRVHIDGGGYIKARRRRAVNIAADIMKAVA